MKPKYKKWRAKTPSKHKPYWLKRNRLEENIIKEHLKEIEKI